MLKDQSEMPFEAPETTDFRWHFETEMHSRRGRRSSKSAGHDYGFGHYSRNDKAVSHRPSTLSVNRSSARVRPRLTAAIGMPRRAAAWTKRRPEYTIRDEPMMSIASAHSRCSWAKAT